MLWLLAPSAVGQSRLRDQVKEAGIDVQRVIFAPSWERDRHLGRLPLADVFLDTWPYNAPTTAAEALWGGCSSRHPPGAGFCQSGCRKSAAGGRTATTRGGRRARVHSDDRGVGG